jgi:hypothetical protein
MPSTNFTTQQHEHSDFMSSKWRPYMAVMYMIVCTCDFVVFPVLWSALQALQSGSVVLQWAPITLQGAGLFHMAMGAVLGVAAWSRGQEKMAGVAVPPSTPTSPPPQRHTAPATNNKNLRNDCDDDEDSRRG